MKFFIKGPSENSNIVELWSSKRLPFQPKGWLYNMRSSLIDAISQMEIVDNAFLRATYHSQVKEFCDLENVLLYNVGSGKFKKLCRRGLVLERSFQLRPYPFIEFSNYLHYQRYEVTTKQLPMYWDVGKILAAWTDISMVKLTSDMKPHEFWIALKEHNGCVSSDEIYKDKYFGLSLQIEMPERSNFNLAAIIKSMLDGIIAAFHVYQGSELHLVSERLANVMSVDAQYVAKLLMDKSKAVLGVRNLLQPYQNNVQWNPADDRCVAINITCKKATEKKAPKISGCIYAATQRN